MAAAVRPDGGVAVPGLKALLFDVFGTCVDWRTSVAREAAALGLPGEAVADAWRARYQPQLETVRSGEREWVVLDVLHREALDDVLDELRLDLAPEQRDELTLAWHRLDPWPDTVPGLTRLKERFVIAPCSNGHIAQSVATWRGYAGLPWDAILGAEIARAYKPDPRVYLRQRRRARPRAGRGDDGRRPRRRPRGRGGVRAAHRVHPAPGRVRARARERPPRRW